MRQLLFISSLISVLVSALMLFAMTVGAQQGESRALAGFSEDCENQPQPCWNGIVPGQSNGYQARLILTRLGYTRLYIANSSLIRRCAADVRIPTCVDVGFRNGCNDLSSGCDLTLVWGVALQYQGQVRLGDILSGMGAPVYVDYVMGRNVLMMYRQHYRLKTVARHPSLFNTVVMEMAAVSYEESIFGDQPWRGLVPFWRYCELEPQAFGC